MKVKINNQSIQEAAEKLVAQKRANTHTKWDDDGVETESGGVLFSCSKSNRCFSLILYVNFLHLLILFYLFTGPSNKIIVNLGENSAELQVWSITFLNDVGNYCISLLLNFVFGL